MNYRNKTETRMALSAFGLLVLAMAMLIAAIFVAKVLSAIFIIVGLLALVGMLYIAYRISKREQTLVEEHDAQHSNTIDV